MRILTVLTYYRPHTSGLTIYAERLAEAFARRGHEVTILTSHFDKSTPAEEVRNGVKIVRAPVLLRVSKGVIMPTFGWLAWKYVAENDVVQMHLPQFDAPGFAFRARMFGKLAILTYHCDLHLPRGLFNRLVNAVVDFQNNMAAQLSNHIVTYTQDYADHSPFLSHYHSKLTPILPPVELPPAQKGAIEAFAETHQTATRRPVIGMATRFATEKGVEILLAALPKILEKYPNAQVLFAGQHLNVMGEQAYFERLKPTIQEFEQSGNWKFLGNQNLTQMAAYYPNLDVLVVSSLNSTEAFGLVQIEAMMNNVPCVASALPGVRRPVQMTGMGQVTPIGDSNALAEAILQILAAPQQYHRDPAEIARAYDPDSVAAEYEKLFARLKKGLMSRFIAFLRAINVGGHTVKMDALRQIFESLGLTGVETFIASGNVIFDAKPGSSSALEKEIESHLQASLGYEVATFIRTSAELAAIVRYQPFPPAQLATAAALNIAFMAAPPDDLSIQKLLALKTDIDDFHVHAREIYWLCRKKQSESTFSNAILEKTLRCKSTLRGMNTLQKLVEKYAFTE